LGYILGDFLTNSSGHPACASAFWQIFEASKAIIRGTPYSNPKKQNGHLLNFSVKMYSS
jgi:hypothetical protein